MPKIRTNRTRPPPEGYEDIAWVINGKVYNNQQTHRSAIISDILEDYAKKMRDAENDPHEGKRKAESVWFVLPESEDSSEGMKAEQYGLLCIYSGQSCGYLMQDRNTSMIYTTSEKLLVKSYMTGYWRKATQTPSESAIQHTDWSN
jgi:hypothetical protein